MRVEKCDYRDVGGTFNKIASVGMFEHLSKGHLREYFETIYNLLGTGGLFLNRGIVRPERQEDGPEMLFMHEKVFPGGHLVHFADVVREGERAGFEVLALEDFRVQYGLTCRAWVKRLLTNQERAVRLVGLKIYRTWLLYLAASAVNFEDHAIGTVQVTFVKPALPRLA